LSKKKLTKAGRKSLHRDTAKKIAVITGARSDFGILWPVIRALAEDEGLDVYPILTAWHGDSALAHAAKLLQEKGFRVSRDVSATKVPSAGKQASVKEPKPIFVPLPPGVSLGGSLVSMAKSFGAVVMGTAEELDTLKPEVVVLEGDRSETFAAAVAAAHLGVVIAHLGGGDSCLGGLDESFRHAITKLAHIHFPATEKAAERIVKMGEREDMVFMVGEPALDVALKSKLPSREEVCEKLGLGPKGDYMIVLQHPVTTQVEKAEEQMRTTLEAVAKLPMQKVVIYPYSDAGSRKMIGVIEKYRGKKDFVIAPNVPHEEFLSLMKHAAVLVGNSSSGIIEAPSFKTPVVNVGQRQVGRETAGNVINVGHSMKAIREGIEKALHDEGFRRRLERVKNPYGDGTASQKIVRELKKVLRRPKLFKGLRQKKIAY